MASNKKKLKMEMAPPMESPPTTSDENADDAVGICFMEWECTKMFDSSQFRSVMYDFEGVQWCIGMERRKETGIDCLGVYLYVEPNLSHLWEIDCVFEIRIMPIGREFAPGDPKQRFTVKYNRKQQSAGVHNMIAWSELMNDEKGYLDEDKMRIEVTIYKCVTRGFNRPQPIDFTDSTDPRHDLTIKIGKDKLYVSRSILALNSSVLSEKIYGTDLKSKPQGELTLKHVTKKEFLDLLQVIYPGRTATITASNVQSLLRLSHVYSIQSVMDAVETFLVNGSSLSIQTKLGLADRYQLRNLHHHCLEHLQSVQAVANLKSSREYSGLSEKTKVSLLERIMALSSSSSSSSSSSAATPDAAAAAAAADDDDPRSSTTNRNDYGSSSSSAALSARMRAMLHNVGAGHIARHYQHFYGAHSMRFPPPQQPPFMLPGSMMFPGMPPPPPVLAPAPAPAAPAAPGLAATAAASLSAASAARNQKATAKKP